MQRAGLVASLQEIIAIAQGALKDVNGRTNRESKATTKSTVKLSSESALPSHILRLRDTGFFKVPKTSNETHAKLQSIYSCDLNRVSMALLRLQKRKHLRKTSKLIGKRTQVAYGW